jgi:hypothetical protein
MQAPYPEAFSSLRAIVPAAECTPIELFAYLLSCQYCELLWSTPRLLVKSLITFKNQPLQQLGIDPAFEEAGFGTSRWPAVNPATKECVWCPPGIGQLREDDPRQKIEQPAHRAMCKTNPQSEI